MPKLARKLPSYRHHKGSGQAVVTLDGQEIYLGVYGLAASRKEYDRVVGEWQANGRLLPIQPQADGITVLELVAAFWRHAQTYYVKDGKPTNEQLMFKAALRPVTDLYGSDSASDFGPNAIKTVRQWFVDRDISRGHANKQLGRIRLMFRWGVENEMIEPSVLQRLQSVAPLKKGRCEARETSPVKPVAMAHVEAVKPLVSSQIKAMIELQLLTGMRPGEVCIMRGCDIDSSGKLWEYRPSSHKTEHHNRERLIPLGPKAQEIVKRFRTRNLKAYLFSPKDAESERHAEAQTHRRATQKRNEPATPRRLGDHYTPYSYRRAIDRACELADKQAHKQQRNVPKDQEIVAKWHPHQLRHNYGTLVRKQYGIEAARATLGHSSMKVSEIYAEQDFAKAAEIAREVG